jgi:hypothetical protein
MSDISIGSMKKPVCGGGAPSSSQSLCTSAFPGAVLIPGRRRSETDLKELFMLCMRL